MLDSAFIHNKREYIVKCINCHHHRAREGLEDDDTLKDGEGLQDIIDSCGGEMRWDARKSLFGFVEMAGTWNGHQQAIIAPRSIGE
jgi:hypothetical protein